MKGYETAEQGGTRDSAQRMAAACEELRTLQPPCWRFRRHGPASQVLRLDDGEYHAVCADCAKDIGNDRRVQRQREERAAMSRR